MVHYPIQSAVPHDCDFKQNLLGTTLNLTLSAEGLIQSHGCKFIYFWTKAIELRNQNEAEELCKKAGLELPALPYKDSRIPPELRNALAGQTMITGATTFSLSAQVISDSASYSQSTGPSATTLRLNFSRALPLPREV